VMNSVSATKPTNMVRAMDMRERRWGGYLAGRTATAQS
jgi:hypothetical protein